MKKRFLCLLSTLLLASCTIGRNSSVAQSSSQPLLSSEEIVSSSKQSSISSVQSSSVTPSSISSISSVSSTVSSFSNSVSSSSSSVSSSISSSSSSSEEPIHDYGIGWYDGYYDSIATWDNAEDLINKLNALMRDGKNSLRYSTPNWESNQCADQAIDDFESVDVVYNDVNVLKTSTQTGWQKEHAFCASLMTSKTTSVATTYLGRATDLHNLFASDASANSSRSDKNYGVADKNNSKYQNRGSYSFDDSYFEPSNKDKGRLARAAFYVQLMYNKDAETEYSTSGKNQITYGPAVIREDYAKIDTTDEHTHYMGNFSTLYKWATTYSVDRLEYQHNESVYSHEHSGYKLKQNNRNPFVDYPELIEYIFGDNPLEGGELRYLAPSCYTLGINSDVHNNYAINTAPRAFIKGDVFHYSDIKLVDVKKNYSYVDYSGTFTCDIKDGATLNFIGTKTVRLNVEGQTIPYIITVEDSTIEGAAYKYNFGGNKTTFNPSKGTEQLKLNGVDWYVTYENSGISLSNVTSPASVQFGNGTIAVKTLTFESASNFTFDSKNNVQGIYIKANCAAGTSYNLKFYVGDSLVYSGTLSYKAKGTDPEYPIYGNALSSPKTGKVKIVISDVSKALYISDIAVNVIS